LSQSEEAIYIGLLVFRRHSWVCDSNFWGFSCHYSRGLDQNRQI